MVLVQASASSASVQLLDLGHASVSPPSHACLAYPAAVLVFIFLQCRLDSQVGRAARQAEGCVPRDATSCRSRALRLADRIQELDRCCCCSFSGFLYRKSIA